MATFPWPSLGSHAPRGQFCSVLRRYAGITGTLARRATSAGPSRKRPCARFSCAFLRGTLTGACLRAGWQSFSSWLTPRAWRDPPGCRRINQGRVELVESSKGCCGQSNECVGVNCSRRSPGREMNGDYRPVHSHRGDPFAVYHVKFSRHGEYIAGDKGHENVNEIHRELNRATRCWLCHSSKARLSYRRLVMRRWRFYHRRRWR